MRIDGYTLTNTGVFQRPGPNYTFEYVRLAVTRGGTPHGVLEPGQRVYDTGQIGNEVDIRSEPAVRYRPVLDPPGRRPRFGRAASPSRCS